MAESDTPMKTLPGKVWLTGAGPGDPELLSIKAARLLAEAKTIVCDRLVSEDILALAGRDTEIIRVGKESKRHTLPQAEINALLVRLARGSGGDIVRLKGGDPLIFGRVGEEIAALVAANIPFEIIPGITSASAAAARAAIPLTHRDYAQSLVFVTAHPQQDGSEPDWEALARPRQTLVFYMGVAAAERVCERLLAHGLDASTPAAVICQTTLPGERIFRASLMTLADCVRNNDIRPPALLIVGKVAGFTSMDA